MLTRENFESDKQLKAGKIFLNLKKEFQLQCGILHREIDLNHSSMSCNLEKLKSHHQN